MWVQECIQIVQYERKTRKVKNQQGIVRVLDISYSTGSMLSNGFTTEQLMDNTWMFVKENRKTEATCHFPGVVTPEINPKHDVITTVWQTKIPDNARIYAEWEE